ncbi:MAG: glycosyltransferase family 2 protein [Verrucomicrobia bacterium]|nr:glycosyltransferase family 2 protein [Verrucomicrobiota bacterium]
MSETKAGSSRLDVSLVVPVYNEEESVELLCEKIHASMQTLSQTYEVILIDDGSKDRTWELLLKMAERYPHLHLIAFRANFGQTAAMSAGIEHATGDVVITLDADLQNDPSDIPLLLERMREGFDVVSGWRKHRKDPFLSRKLPSMIANGLISKITGVALHDYGCTLKAYRREVIQDVRLYGEMHRFIPALASWVGGKVTEVAVNHHPRRFGTSKYNINRTFRVVLDLMTVKFLLSYSRGPMQIFGRIAAWSGIPGLLILTTIVLGHLSFLVFGTEFAADLVKRPFWVMTSFMLIFFGIQFICMGLLAEILIRTWHESQNKKIYIVRETRKSPSGGAA